jgi:hypothetical protein
LLGTLTHGLKLILRNPCQSACGFEFKAQLLSEYACRKGDCGTAAMATIGNPYKRPIGPHLVAKPQHIGIAMTTRRWCPGCGGWLNPLLPGLYLATRSPFDPFHPFAFAQM